MIKFRKNRIIGFMLIIISMANILLSFSSSNAITETDIIEIFISTNGIDTNTGTIDSPVSTLEKARDIIRTQKSNGINPSRGFVVSIRGGVYKRTSTFTLEQIDSGTPTAPIIYKAYNNENVILQGGENFSFSNLEPINDESIKSRLYPEVRDKVLQVSLPALGITNYGELPLYGHSMYFLNAVTDYKSGSPAPELFCNGELMTLARHPNTGYDTIQSVVEQGSVVRNWMDDKIDSSDYVPPEERDDPPKGFEITLTDVVDRWTMAEDLRLYGYWYWDWSDQSVQISSVNTVNKTVSSIQPSAYGVLPGQRFFAYNLLEEIDMPGEWYLNRDTGILYIYPTTNNSESIFQLSTLTENMITLNNVSNVSIDGINFQISRGKGIEVKNGNNNIIRNCSISNIAGRGITISGKDNGVINSHIFNTGAGGIALSGGDRQTLTSAGNYAHNNEIHNYSRIQKTYIAAIGLNGVGNRATNNKIYDGPHLAIVFYGNEHIIEYNEIFDVCKESDDMAAIYAGRSHTFWGNKIRYNYFHDIYGLPKEETKFNTVLTHAIYLDDTLSGVEITGNIFNRVNEVLAASGSDIIFSNNIIINSNDSVWIKTDSAGHREGERIFDLNNTIDKDIMSVPYKSRIWVDKYPDLVESIDKTYGIMRNVIKDNVLINTPNIKMGDNLYKYGVVKDNYNTSVDIGFEDMANGNFNLKKNASIYEVNPNFKKIDFSKIGRRPQESINNNYIDIDLSGTKNILKMHETTDVNILGKRADGVHDILTAYSAHSFPKIEYSSGDSNIIEVNQYGEITAKNIGNSRITVKLINNDGSVVVKYFTITVGDGPIAEEVRIDGTFDVGMTIKGTYKYYNTNNIEESGSICRWLASDSKDNTVWEEVYQSTTTVNDKAFYTLAEDVKNKYIKLEITPIDINGNLGKIVVSEPVLVKENIASKKPVTAHRLSGPDGSIPAFVVDGDIDTAFQVHNPSGYIIIDLLETSIFNKVELFEEKYEGWYKIGNFWLDYTMSENPTESDWIEIASGNKIETFKEVFFSAVTGRKVRFRYEGKNEISWFGKIREIKVFSTPIKTTFNMDKLLSGQQLSSILESKLKVSKASLIFLALYDEDNKLIKLSKINDIIPNTYNKIMISIDLPEISSGYYAKFFLWENEEMLPMIKSKILY